MFSLKKIISKLGIGLVLFFMILGMSFTSEAFLSTNNIFNILLQVSVICVISVGMTYVILTGGIDLSVGSIVALSAVCLGLFTHWGVALLGENPTEPMLSIVVIVSVLGSIGVGALCGYVNGVIIVYGKVTSFITTLGMMGIARGLALTLSNGKTIYNFPEALRFFGNGRLNITYGFGIPIPVIIALIVVLISFYILTQTVFGRQVYALGGNREAVRLSGINVNKLEIKTYVINGALAAIGAVILVGRLNAAQPIAGTGYELDAIAATVIGGTSLMGGVGSVISTSIGALIMGVLQNGLTLLNVTSYLQRLIIGLVIILAVFLDQLRRGEVSTGRLRRIFFRE
ncbi:Ribose transport system permease protein rbsC [Aggregatibacter actinomycetemcomitans]|uniref:ABC transporter permease n=1 Tax=Aggregatibacter actinomycetemcomitans TaxID=714 RepID=UPI0001B9F33C|nr:ABC transporter permease [Aggregatibacter actinomycetemcomitans]ACX82114.1 sugar ABC transporter ATPase [Aggregatibacter actinomycetemcomitans D11S-1]KOE60290.1 sugar ABC transporter ATPase [Aggregatibacter actinomycetemcomitans serotype c str. SCC2302]KOE61518.1 sugar ABC transporter ATPase [Aggregatibacter actinomycetemcomitans serotype c str. AAS4A]KOE62211.1 sugar ABC transporter ATPase [Aggregatibacter actinomycetemcomitans serotype c str. D17P-2]KYK74149.1 ribose ABC transporter perme